VVQQVVVVVTDDRSQDARQLPRRDWQVLLGELASDDGLPNVILKLINVSHKTTLITALVTIVILDEGNKVSGLERDWQVRFRCIPLPLIFRNPDIAFDSILLAQQVFEDEH
jgi:hypothetical protein